MTPISETSVQFIKGVGPARAKLFENLGVRTIEDLLYLFPRRYEDRRKLTPIKDLKLGEFQAFTGEVLSKTARRSFWNKKQVFEISVGDDESRVFCVWFNQPYLDKYFHEGDKVVLYGKVELFDKRLQVVCPEHEVISKGDEALNIERIVPMYPLTRGMSQRYLRKVVYAALEKYSSGLQEVLPEAVRQRQKLDLLPQSIRDIHFPSDEKAQAEAVRRVSFEEFFLFQVSVMLRRMSLVQKPGLAHKIPAILAANFEKAFPFALTHPQKKAISEISADMTQKRPMLRLLQGDVGSGKTVVAFFGCLVAVSNGKQAAVMAPTEILAEQHYMTFQKFFSSKQRAGGREQGYKAGSRGQGAGHNNDDSLLRAPCSMPIRTALLNSSLKPKDKAAAQKAIAAGEIDIVFGTHALIQDEVAFKDLSFVVVDEQHKFGVKQRAYLSAKGKNPDVLVMTATPIPRTLCLTLYGDLDVSVINEKPKGRGEIRTYHFGLDQAEAAYKKVGEWVKKGTQAYIVYPVIDESEKDDLKAATGMYERFVKNEFKDFRVGLIHGRLARGATQEIMNKFKAHEIDILVTTTVLEVGIDVPNANVMLIEHAERFGLSQLHQLRGRIGRSEKGAVCLLLGDPQTEEGQKRLDVLVKTNDGFKVAEEDLKIRGPGQYFGRHQHGLNELRVVNPLTQIDILEAARKEASVLVGGDPALAANALIRETIQKRYPEYLQRVLAG